MVRLEPNLRVGETRQVRPAAVCAWSRSAISRLLRGRAVVPESVGLDDEPEIGPEEVDLEAVDTLPVLGSERPASCAMGQEATLELGVGKDERADGRGSRARHARRVDRGCGARAGSQLAPGPSRSRLSASLIAASSWLGIRPAMSISVQIGVVTGIPRASSCRPQSAIAGGALRCQGCGGGRVRHGSSTAPPWLRPTIPKARRALRWLSTAPGPHRRTAAIQRP